MEIIGNRECTDKIGMKLSFMNNMLETGVEKEKENRGLIIIYATIISWAIIITLAAVSFHSMLSPASISEQQF